MEYFLGVLRERDVVGLRHFVWLPAQVFFSKSGGRILGRTPRLGCVRLKKGKTTSFTRRHSIYARLPRGALGWGVRRGGYICLLKGNKEHDGARFVLPPFCKASDAHPAPPLLPHSLHAAVERAAPPCIQLHSPFRRDGRTRRGRFSRGGAGAGCPALSRTTPTRH